MADIEEVKRRLRELYGLSWFADMLASQYDEIGA